MAEFFNASGSFFFTVRNLVEGVSFLAAVGVGWGGELEISPDRGGVGGHGAAVVIGEREMVLFHPLKRWWSSW